MQDCNTDNISSWFVRKLSNPSAQDNDGKQAKSRVLGQQPSEELDKPRRGKHGPAAMANPAPDRKEAAHPDAVATGKTGRESAASVATEAAVGTEKKASGAAKASAADRKAAEAVGGKKLAGPAIDKKGNGESAAPCPNWPACDSSKQSTRAARSCAATATRQPSESDSEVEADKSDKRAAKARGKQQCAQQAAAASAQQDEDAEYRPRVLAYSDSDSDVESHIQRVKTHLLPHNEEEESVQRAAAEAAAAEAAEAEAAIAAAAAQRRTPLRRLGTAAGAAAAQLAPHLTSGLAMRAGGLLLLGHMHPAAGTAAGLLSMAVPLADAAASKAGWDVTAVFPGPLMAAKQEFGELGKAAAALTAGSLLLSGLQHQRRRQRERRVELQQKAAQAVQQSAVLHQHEEGVQTEQPDREQLPGSTPGRLLRRRSSVNLAALGSCADLGAAVELMQPQTAAEWAAVHQAGMREMRRMLQEMEVELPANRFDSTNAELMRFAKACGLLTAKTADQQAAALEGGVSRVVHTLEWTAKQRFMTDRELRRWDRLVAWRAHDASGRPILLARVGRALQLVKPERYDDFVTALLTLLHKGLSSQLSNMAGPAEQMVVVVDCRGCTSMGLTRHMGMLKRLAVALNQHFPDRLYRLYLLELPLLLRWALHGITPLLHPTTRSKLVFSGMDNPDLPVTVAFLSKRRSGAKPSSLKRSISTCSFPSSGDATPALLSPQQTPSSTALTAAVNAEGGREMSGIAQQLQAEPAQQSGHGRHVLEEDVPGTPPPTLKAPQSPHPKSPRELLRPRLLPQQTPPETAAVVGQAVLGSGSPVPSPLLGSQVERRPEPQLPAAGQQPSQAQQGPQQHGQQRVATPARSSLDGQLPVPPAASATAGLTSHAVPWSPGMQTPTGTLSRDTSCGEDVALEASSFVIAAAAAGGAQQVLSKHPLGDLPDCLPSQLERQGREWRLPSKMAPLPVLHLAATSSPPAPTVLAAPGSTSPAGKLGSLLSVLVRSPWRGGSSGQGKDLQQGQQDLGRMSRNRHLRPTRLPLAHIARSGGSGNALDRLGSGRGRVAGGLVELPERGRLTGGRLHPRKSSLRRVESADSLHVSRKLGSLGSHPLCRQSSVSWADELECVKEILPLEATPPLQAPHSRLGATSAAGHSQMLLMAVVAVMLMVAMVQRGLLTFVP